MENMITIPYTLDTIKDLEDITIDMSDLRFDCPEDKKKFYAFIFIRNTGIKANLNFDKCSFEDKEEYLKMFLTSNIELKCPILASTWIEILLFDNSELYLPSIFNKDDINKFIERNKNLIDNIHQFINSLPIYSIYLFSKTCNMDVGIDEIETTDNDDIKLINFYQLSEFKQFILLLNPSYEHRPLFYTKIFDNKNNLYDFMRIMNNLPYMNLLNGMFANSECQTNLINGINNVFEKEE